MDKLIDALKWVGDSPFRLVALICLAVMAGGGFFVWEMREDFKHALRGHLVLRDQADIEAAAKPLLRDTEARAVIVHEMNVGANERVTRLALSKDNGRYRPLHGYTVSLFNNGSNNRNDAAIAMLRGEVYCKDFKSSSKAGKFMDRNGVKYLCRAGIGPIGKMHGYIAVGFKKKPEDMVSARARILIAVKEMCR